MAQQKFGNRFRQALWETHGKKCFHCSEELLFVDMRVDHLVPEHYHHGAPAAREAMLAEAGLPQDFNILGHENLAPSCANCNDRKAGNVFVGGALIIAITRAGKQLHKLRANLDKKTGERALESLLRAAAASVDSGKFTREEFLSAVDQHLPAPNDIIELKFETGVVFNRPMTRFGFTEHAHRAMEARGLLAADIADAVLNGLTDGTATVARDDADENHYVIQGENDLKVVFVVVRGFVVVLTAYRD